MRDKISHLKDGDILHFTASGAMNSGDDTHMWEYMKTVSHEKQAKRILIECTTPCGRISMEHCFDLIEKIPFISRHLACKIALFEKHMSEETRELLKFVETAVTDRGAHFKLFGELEEARLWLNK